MSVYAYYPDRRWMVDGPGWGLPMRARRPHSAYWMNGAILTSRWARYMNQMLACGGATVTGKVVIDGVDTTRIDATPVTVRLSKAYRKVIHERWDREGLTMYVSTSTYLPVRIVSWDESYGGSTGRTHGAMITDIKWLPPTPANIARTLVTVPPGFTKVTGPGSL